jgi:hypothetical protein
LDGDVESCRYQPAQKNMIAHLDAVANCAAEKLLFARPLQTEFALRNAAKT